MVIGHGAESYVVRNSRVNVLERWAEAAMNRCAQLPECSLSSDELDHLALGPAAVVHGIAVAHT
jgi:hypothetical protein